MRIVTAMRTTAFLLAIFLVCAAPAFAQTNEVGFLIGGSKRLISHTDQSRGLGVSDNFKFSNSDREIFYGVQLDPGTFFKVRVGQIEGPVAFRYTNAGGTPARTDIRKGTVEHADAVIDYRFSEPFGTTGLFAGVGLYRQRGTLSDQAVPVEQRGVQTETNYGLLGGVNGDFPITKNVGFIAELTYHWINYNYKVRYLTLGGGLRFSF
jgi:outer membrane protein with beta-barrel domain